MSIEQAIRTMLLNGSTPTVPDARITHGFRPQSTDLPAITYEVTSTELATCGTNPIREAEVEIRSIALTGDGAISVAEDVQGCCVEGTYSTVQLQSITYHGHRLETPSVGDGDESEPFEAVSRITVLYKE